jgi:tetratricopeptide (TPR) repeat protein
MLSFHFLAAQDWARTWKYAQMAARHAEQAHAPAEAATHLERAITASRRLGDEVRAEVAGVLTDLGRARELLGEYERADEAYGQAARATKHEPVLHARLAYLRAHIRNEYLGRPSAAIRILRAGRAELAAVDGQAAGLDALLLAQEANVRERQGHLAQGVACARLAVPAAERAGDKRALALALEVLNSCLTRSGQSDQAVYMDRVLALYTELGDDVKVAIALSHIAAQAFFSSQWDRAADFVARSAAASDLAGDLPRAASARANLGELRTNQGRLDEAMALLVPAQRALESYGYRLVAASAGIQLGRASAFKGDLEGGLALLRAAGSICDEINSLVESLEARARLAEVLVFASQLDEARTALADARSLEADVGETPLSLLLDRIELTLAASSGEGATVTAGLDDFIERARAMGSTYDALVVLALAERLGDESVGPQVMQMSQELSVVALPMLPGAVPLASRHK